MAGTAANLAKQEVDKVRDGLNSRQVKLRTSKRFKLIVVAVTFFAALVDFLGTVIVMPMLPSLCMRAPSGPYHIDTVLGPSNLNWQCSASATASGTCAAEKEAAYEAFINSDQVKAILSPHAFKDLSMPISSSIEVPMAISQFFSAIGSFSAGPMVDRVGAKKPILVCLFMGLIGYMMIYAAGIWVKSYWLFAGGLWLNSLFGVVTDIAMTYMAQLFADSPSERDAYVGLINANAILGATIGAFVVMPFASGNGANAFYAIWLAIGLTILAFLLVLFVLVTPHKAEKEKKVIHPTPRVAKRLLITTSIASCLDSGGDVGTQMARSTILMG